MSIDAMKMALEALNQIKNANIKGLYLLPDFHNAITALRQAIKDEEEAFRPDYDTNAVLLERIRELEAQLEQAEKQEPVGEVLNIQWMSNTGGWLIGFHSKQRLYKGDKLYVEPMSIKPENIDTKTERVDSVNIEPVAWIYKDGTTTSDPDRADGTWTPLYTAPMSTKQENIDTKTEHVDSVNIEPVINAYYVYRVALEGIGTHEYDFKTHTNIYRGEAPSEEFVTLYRTPPKPQNELDAIDKAYFAGKQAGAAECEAVKEKPAMWLLSKGQEPPKREWQSLAEKEIFQADNAGQGLIEFARAIEQRLKEKNHEQK